MDKSETRGALHAFNIPLIAVGHKKYIKHYDNILSTAPDVQGQAKVEKVNMNYDSCSSLPFIFIFFSFQALANIIYEMSQEKVAIITEEEKATVKFLSEASELGIGVTNVLEFRAGANNKSQQALSYINALEGKQPVIVMILDALTILDIAEAISQTGIKNAPIWIMATVGLRQMKLVYSWRQVFNGGVVLEPYLPELDQFQRYFQRALRVNTHIL